MDLLDKTIKLCKLYNIKPARSKGQNFLVREAVYDRIIEAGDIKKTDIIMEVGPGLGFLTAKISKKADRVVAVELDDKLADYLKGVIGYEDIDNIEILNENVLDTNVKDLGFCDYGYKIIANLPYNITSVFIRKMLTSDITSKLAVLMLQKEVAERIVAKPGAMSLLAVSVQFYAKAEIIMDVSRNDFYPRPAVDSAVIKIITKTKDELFDVDEKKFFRLVKIGFSAKRKMLKKNLAGGLNITKEEVAEKLNKLKIKETARAQELSVEDWVKLADLLKI